MLPSAVPPAATAIVPVYVPAAWVAGTVTSIHTTEFDCAATFIGYGSQLGAASTGRSASGIQPVHALAVGPDPLAQPSDSPDDRPPEARVTSK